MKKLDKAPWDRHVSAGAQTRPSGVGVGGEFSAKEHKCSIARIAEYHDVFFMEMQAQHVGGVTTMKRINQSSHLLIKHPKTECLELRPPYVHYSTRYLDFFLQVED